jgi:glycosyltransferase involved in cell wall biosynthesis
MSLTAPVETKDHERPSAFSLFRWKGALRQRPDRRHGILQTLRATTPPLSQFVDVLSDQLTPLERAIRRVVSSHFAAGWELFRRRNRYQVVITADYRTALIFGGLCNLFGRKSLHVVKELYLDSPLLGSRLARRVFRWCLRRCDCVITNCSAEVPTYSRYLSLASENFRFLPWPANIPAAPDPGDDGSVFAAGRSCRDWETMFKAAKMIAARVVVVAEAAHLTGLAVPANVELHCDIPREQYLGLLRKARVVVVPVRPTVRSAGQAAILEAMALGKPVLTAQTPGVADYITPGVNGAYYQANDPSSLAGQLERLLGEPELRRQLGHGAIRSVEAVFNKKNYARKVMDLLEEILACRLLEPNAGRNRSSCSRP